MNKKGFTLIEILVVATIIGLLAAGAAVSYSQFSKQSRDAKRKTDMENIRAALEMFKSNSTTNVYPTTITIGSCTPSATGITDGTNTYLSKIPTDPKCTSYKYYYESDGTTYTLAAQLETTSTCSSGSGIDRCGTGNNCNYCLGPYGQQ